MKVHPSGFWVNPKFPFLGCSPDGLVGSDTVIVIKSLKILKQYSVETVTSPTSPVAKSVPSRQCFKVEDGKCILKRSHGYYFQCQHIFLVTDRKYCDFILHATSGPDSVERIARDDPSLWRFCIISRPSGHVLLLQRSLKCVSPRISYHLFRLRLLTGWILLNLLVHHLRVAWNLETLRHVLFQHHLLAL